MKKGKDDLPLQRISVDKLEINMEVDLERALELCGAGKYQVFHCILMVTILGAAMLEMIGSSFILPAAACDLDIPDNLRGIIASIPNIGVILTAPFWGRAADTFGRKPVLLLSTAVAGVIALASSFMPNLLSFALCKFAGSLLLHWINNNRDDGVRKSLKLRSRKSVRYKASPPASGRYTSLFFNRSLTGDLKFRKSRETDIVDDYRIISILVFSWGVLSYDWHTLGLQPWRVLTAVLATPLVLAALWLTQARESPKFLMTNGKPTEALEVLRHIFARNSGCAKNNYCTSNTTCVDSISHGTFQITVVTSVIYGTLVLLVSLSPLTKKALLVGMYALVGATCLVSALTTNRIIAGISMSALQITALGIGPLCAYTVQLFPTSLRSFHRSLGDSGPYYEAIVSDHDSDPASGMFVEARVDCFYATMRKRCGSLVRRLRGTNSILKMLAGRLDWAYWDRGSATLNFCVLDSSGTAVGAVLMFGRLGSVSGANAAGIFLAGACTATFYGFAALLFLCAGLSFLLPRDQPASKVG
ncbi:jg18951 [Pararge aegeria aegeria]|uniref:Jg18951 protein n=1 Tax=Pararge aegeria aegeria TaxID=348720 RepID=A0A8S4SK06_9NEOP|nr:jg18951 [Pararge aegeria aegeria]